MQPDDLATIYKAFTRNRLSLGRGARTIEQYTYAVRALEDFLVRSEGNTAIDALPYAVIEDFLIDYMARGRGKATANKTFRSLRALFNWAAKRRLIAYNPFTELQAPRPQTSSKHGYSTDEVRQMFADVRQQMTEPGREGFLARRDHALMLVLYDTGLRATEICNIKANSVDMTTGLFEVRGKGDRLYRRHLGIVARTAVQTYLAAVRFPVGDDTPLWRGWTGVVLTRSGLFRMNRTRAALAGVKNGGVHRWRYTHAEILEEMGWPEDIIMAEMGHSVLSVSRAYRERAIRRRAMKQHEEDSPADKMAII